MPKIEISPTKGLVQKPGSGVVYKDNTVVQGASQLVVGATGADARITLTKEQSGAFCHWAGSNASHFTLPSPESGLRFTFFASTDHAHKLIATSNILQGSVIHNANGTTLTRQAVANRTSITMHSSNNAVSDYIDCWCDGTNWYVEARTNDAVTLA